MPSSVRRSPTPHDQPPLPSRSNSWGVAVGRHPLGNCPPTYDAGVEVVAIRRYPVKAMGGESLQHAEVVERGLTWDRWYAVVDEDGRLACAKDSRRFRRRDAVFEYAASAGSDQVTVTRGGLSWQVGDPELDRHLSQSMDAAVSVQPEQATPHMDDSPVSLVGTASLRWCAERYGGPPDARRLRANLVVETDEPFVEETWVGREVRIGSTVVRFTANTVRCRTIDLAQDGVAEPSAWLQPLGERDLELAVYAEVVRPGRISVGDEIGLGSERAGSRAQ